jgi:hypothetical protein
MLSSTYKLTYSYRTAKGPFYDASAVRYAGCQGVSPALKERGKTMQQQIVLDTLGKLHGYGVRLFGWCRDCGASTTGGAETIRPPTLTLTWLRAAPIAPWSGSRPSPARGADREGRRRGCCLRAGVRTGLLADASRCHARSIRRRHQ